MIFHLGLPSAVGAGVNIESGMPAFYNPVRTIFLNVLPQHIQGRARAMSLAIVLPVSLVVCGILVFSMASHPAVMLGHLDSMYAQFGFMSDDMQVITQSVENIGGKITGMPVIARNMNVMSMDMLEMVHSVGVIDHATSGMQSSTGAIGVNTGAMALRSYHPNRAVNRICYNVNQMGKPFP